MSSEHRKHYRPGHVDAEVLTVAITYNGTSYPAQVLNTSVGGMALALETSPSIPLFESGQTIYLQITASSLSEPLEEPAVIGHRKDWGEENLYGIRLVDWMGFIERIPAELAAVFNRRLARRVSAEEHMEVWALLELRGKKYKTRGLMVDISPDGMSFAVTPKGGKGIAEAGRIRLFFRLPNAPEGIAFDAQSRHITEDADQWTVGAYFEPEDGVSFEERRQKVLEYVSQSILSLEEVPII